MTEIAGGRRWSRLSNACASVGFSLNGPVALGEAGRSPRELEKCELGVVGTTVLTLCPLVAESRSDDALARGLPVLGRRLRELAVGRPHLERFALSPLLRDDACAWGAEPGV